MFKCYVKQLRLSKIGVAISGASYIYGVDHVHRWHPVSSVVHVRKENNPRFAVKPYPRRLFSSVMLKKNTKRDSDTIGLFIY